MRSNKGYGWIPDLPDKRDYAFSALMGVARKLPVAVDMRALCAAIFDQGALGSCTANAIAAAYQFSVIKQFMAAGDTFAAALAKSIAPARLFIYYLERAMEGTVNEDSGAMIRDGIKAVAKQGVCPEADYPYVISKFRNKPSAQAYKDALDHQALTYYRVQPTLAQMLGCLAAGFPFVFGFSVYESFESATVAKTGKVPMPKSGESQLGGHAVLAVGFDDTQKRFIVRNSWGVKWGLKGYFTMPMAYLLDPNLSADFWTVRLVE
jgi:C1A family cysteine protease